jgi:hypothetical protein
MTNTLTHQRLHYLLSYDRKSGKFRWKIAENYYIKVGDIAGSVHPKGYRTITIDGIGFRAHRLAWFWMLGFWPTDEIDHDDLDKDNNAWVNLREATRYENLANQRVRKNSTTGVKGVHFHLKTGKYMARIGINGERKFLGEFDLLKDATEAYATAAKAAFGDFARTE